jgi:hypothetical protein
MHLYCFQIKNIKKKLEIEYNKQRLKNEKLRKIRDK